MSKGFTNRTESGGAEDFYKVIFLSLISILLLILEPRVAGIKLVREAVNYGIAPLQITADWLTSQQRATALFFARGREHQQLVITLERENLLLRTQAAELRQLRAENRQLRAMLAYKNTAGPAGAAPRTSNAALNGAAHLARVIGGSTNTKIKELLFDLGAVDGIKEGMIIRDADGLLGQVILAGFSSSKGLLLTDPRHSVPVKVARTQHRFILDGFGEAAALQAIDLPADIGVLEGDVLVTSGLGGIFPPGIPVAQVYSIIDKPRISLRDLYARPLGKPELAEFIIVHPGLDYQLPAEELSNE